MGATPQILKTGKRARFELVTFGYLTGTLEERV
jgi:hypothetical protein